MKYVVQFDNRYVRFTTQVTNLSQKPVPYTNRQKAAVAARAFKSQAAEQIKFYKSEMRLAKVEIARIQRAVASWSRVLKKTPSLDAATFEDATASLELLREQADAMSRAYQDARREWQYLRGNKPRVVWFAEAN
jgi:hypothetical protein